MSDLVNFGLHAASGGLFGMVGTIGGRVLGFFEKKDDRKHELALMEFKSDENKHDLIVMGLEFKHEEKLHRINMDAAEQETESELALSASKGSWAGLAPSMLHDTNTGLADQWVINFLRLVRPIITFALWFVVWVLVKMDADPSFIGQAIFAATAATLWWFGDRAPSQSEMKMRQNSNV